MSDILESPLFTIAFIFIFVIGFLGATFIGLQYLDVKVINDYPVKATVNGELFYSGPKACLSIDSAGDTTKITAHNGFLCIFPYKTYTGLGVEIK